MIIKSVTVARKLIIVWCGDQAPKSEQFILNKNNIVDEKIRIQYYIYIDNKS